jgi:hypothetical protein
MDDTDVIIVHCYCAVRSSSVASFHWTVAHVSWNGRRWLYINRNDDTFYNWEEEESIRQRSPIIFKENKRKYADEEEEVSFEEKPA